MNEVVKYKRLNKFVIVFEGKAKVLFEDKDLSLEEFLELPEPINPFPENLDILLSEILWSKGVLGIEHIRDEKKRKQSEQALLTFIVRYLESL